MSWRRRDSRWDVFNSAGVLRVWRDVLGHRTAAGEYLVLSNEPGVKGEQLTMYLATSAGRPLSVRVADSRPLIVDGSVRHQLRLVPMERGTCGGPETANDGNVEGA
jgi:hypothetical protein